MKSKIVFIIMSLIIIAIGIFTINGNFKNPLSVVEASKIDNSNYNNVRVTLENSNIINLEKEKVNDKEIKVSIENNNPYPVCLKIYCEEGMFHSGHGGYCSPSKSVTESIPSICLNANEKLQTWIGISTTKEIREGDYDVKVIIDSATSGEKIKEIPMEIFVK